MTDDQCPMASAFPSGLDIAPAPAMLRAMKIGVLGSGIVAQTLGTGFIKHGHEVVLGTRSPAKLAEWRKKNPKAKVGSFADAAKFAQLAVLAVKGTVASDAILAAGAE